MDLGDIHTFIRFIENKEQIAWHTPTEIDSALQRSQTDIFSMYEPMYGIDEMSTTALSPFSTDLQITGANSVGGLVSMPSNFVRKTSFYVTSFDNTYGTQYCDVDIVNEDEFANRMRESQLIPVDQAHPIAKLSNGKLQLYPQIPNSGYLTYLRKPAVPNAVYTQVGRVLTYNQSASTQLEWNESFITKIISKALFYLGINIEDQLVIQLMGQNINS